MSFFENTRKPIGLGGKMMVCMMNFGHRALADWGFRFLHAPENATVLDCGCGGGANIKKLLKICPKGRVFGIDYATVSVTTSQRNNRAAIKAGRCAISQAGVTDLPFESAAFDLVTAFETVYFWSEPVQGFREILRVLKPDGSLLICNECGGIAGKGENWEKKIDGMTVYGTEELASILKKAGFQNIRTYKNRKGWICVTAQK